MADGEFDVVLAIIPEGQDEAAAKTNTLTEAVRQGGEASKGASAAADQLSAADLRRVEALAATVQAMQRQMAATAEVQRQQILLAQQVQQATGASAVEMARANQVAANVQGLRDRTAVMQAQLEVARQGPEAERAWAAAEALRLQIAATGAAPGSPGVASAEAELVAQERLAQELAAITAARERDAGAAAAEAAAQRQLSSVLSSLQGATAQTAERTAAERQGVAAVTAYNTQLATRNALLQAGVAEVGAQGQLVILNEEGAAAIQHQVAALEAERAALGQVIAAQAEVSVAWQLLSGVMDSVLQAGKWLILYGGLIKIWQAIKDAVEETIKLEESLTRLRTLVGLNAQEVEGFRSAIHAIALETGQSADENAKALFAVTSSGLRGEQALLALRASAEGAAIGLGDQTTVARAATAAMVAYGAGNLSAKGALDVIIATAREGNVSVDQLAGSFGRVIPVAATVGVSFAQVGAAVASMTRLGLSADEAVTALRGTLTALTLKEAKGADAALKSVGYSLDALKASIHEKGLAQALVELVQKFGGNEEALAKIIPNVRALTEVLGNAKSQAGEYVAIQERVNSAIGHATDDAFKLVQADPAFVFRQTKTAVAELAMSLVEGLLPQLVAVAQRIKEAATSGDFKGFSETISVAFRVVVVAGEAVSLVLSNLPIAIAAVTVAMIANGSAATAWGTLVTSLSARLEALWATIAANPFGALAVAIGVALIAINKLVDASRAADQAFLDSVAKENQTSVALGHLAASYLTVAQAARQAATDRERASVAGAIAAGSPVVLKAGDASFEGQLEAISQRYRDQVAAAHGAKEAIAAAEAARKADTSALQAHQQALIDDEAAALSNRQEALRGVALQYAAANDRLQQLRDAYANPLAQRKGQEIAPGQIHVQLEQAQQDVQHLGNVVKVWSQQVALGTVALDAQRKQLDASRRTHDDHTAGVVKATHAAENARFEIEKGIAARELAARSAAVLASAELQGAEAVRQATIVAQADALIEADRQRAKKAGIELTALQEQRIRASTAALSDANQIARLNQQIFASGEADHAAAVTNEAKLADAQARNTLASQLAAAQLQVENAQLKNGIPLWDERVRQLVAEAQARVLANAQTDIAVANAKRDLDFAIAQRQAAADLADARNQNLEASTALADQLEIENRVASEGAVLDKKRTAEIAAQVIGRHLDIDQKKTDITVTKELQAQTLALAQAEAKFRDEQSYRSAVHSLGQDAADSLQKYGLLSAATQVLAIHQEALHLVQQKGETRTLEQLEAELTLRQKQLNDQARGFAQEELHTAARAKLYTDLAAVFDQIGSAAGGTATKLGQVAIALSGLASALANAGLSAKKWSAEWASAIVGVVGQVGALFKAFDVGGSQNTGGASQFGGKLPGNYAGAGTIVGGIVGAIVGYFVGNVAAGAQIGAALGGVLGAMITKAGDSASAALTTGGVVSVEEVSTQLSGAVRDTLLNIFKGLNLELAKLGLVLSELPLIDVKIRDNVVRVVVGTIVRTFSSMQDAISFGVSEALRQAGTIGSRLAPEVVAALKHSTATDLAGLEADIKFAQDLANYGVRSVVLAIDKSVSDFYVAMQRAAQLGIDSTKEIARFRDELQAQKDALLGIDKTESPEDRLRRDAAAFDQRALLLQSQAELDKANLLVKKADLLQEEAFAKAQFQLLIVKGQTAKARLEIDQKEYEAQLAVLQGLAAALEAVDVAIATTQGILDSIILITDDEINQALARLRNIGTHGGGATGPSPVEQMNAELEKLSRTNLPTAVNAVIDLGLQLADLTKRTKDAHASEELLAKARQALIDQAKAQILDPVRGSLLPGQGGTFGQTQAQQAAAAADKAFADAEAAQRKLIETTGQRAIAFWQLQDAHLRALNVLTEQDIAGLNLPMEATRKKVSDLRDSLGFLWEMFGRGALAADRFVEVLAQLQEQTGNELLGLAQGLLSTIGDTEEAAKVKHALDVASFELQRLQINYLYQQYKALGLVSAAVQVILDEALAKINAFDSSKVGAAAAGPAPGETPGSAGLSPAEYAAAVAADKARYLGTITGAAGGAGLTADQALQGLAQYELAQQSQLAQQIAKVNADFASYRAVLGDTAQVQRDYALALRSVITGALQPLQSFLDGLNTSQFSPLKALDQLAASQQTFEKAIAAVQGGDLAHLGDLTSYAQAYLQQALSSLPVGSDEYKRIEARVEAEVRAILAQYGSTAPPPAGGPGAAPPPGGTPPAPPPVDVKPVVDAVRDVAADQLVELKEITRNTRETQQEVYALRRRLDDPVTVFERVS